MIRIEPQPRWQEDPGTNDQGEWCGRYEYLATSFGSFPPEEYHEVGVDVVKPPSDDVRPVQVDGIWYWKSIVFYGRMTEPHPLAPPSPIHPANQKEER